MLQIIYYRTAHINQQIQKQQKHATAKLQWLKHLWNHEKMFETGVVLANEC